MNSQMASLSSVAPDAASSETNPSFDVTTFAENFAVLAEGVTSVLHLRRLAMTLAVRGRIILPDLSTPHPFAGNAPPEEPEGAFESPHVSPSDDELAEVSVPSNWAKLKLGSLVNLEYGKSLPKNSRAGHGKFPVFGSNGVVGVHDEALVAEPCIIVGRKGSSGAVALSPGPCWPIDTAYFVRCPKALLIEYLLLVLRVLRLDRFDRSTAIPGLNRADAYALTVTVPPMAEQKRIVAKVDQLMALCDDLESRQTKTREVGTRLTKSALEALTTTEGPAEFDAAWKRVVDNFDILVGRAEMVNHLRQAALDLAIRGRLTRRDLNEEPASELRSRIMTRLGVTDTPFETQPFPLPSGWCWARFPELGLFGRGKSKHRPRNDPKLFHGAKYPLVQTGDVARSCGEILTHTSMYGEAGLAQSRLWPKGTLCITIAANIADSGLLGFDACFPDSVVGFVPDSELGSAQYFEFFLRTAKRHIEDFAPATAQKNINLEILGAVLVPLPPKAEMLRIVATVEQLMKVCDELEEKLRRTEDRAARLVEAAVQELIAS